MGKDKAACVFRRVSSGEVFGEIIDEKGVVADTENFGVMTESEYHRILKLMELEYPDIVSLEPIELTGN